MQLERKARCWFDSNGLSMNEAKTQRIVISSNPRDISGECVRLLGVVIDDGLTWQEHVSQLCRKLSSSLFLLRRLRKHMDDAGLMSLYYAVFYSHINYGVVLWGNAGHAVRVFRMQKRAVRILATAGNREHCRPLFVRLRLMTLPCLYIFQSLLEIHKNKHLFKTNSYFHDHHTRTAGHLRPDRLRLQKSVKNSLPLNLYNKLSNNTKNLTFNKFKGTVKDCLLGSAFYSIEEYVSTPLDI